MPLEKLEAFLKLASSTAAGFRDAFSGRTSPTDFFPMRQTPILRLENQLVVLDPDFLFERITSGLYYLVFDHEKSRLPDPSKYPTRWTQAFGEMFELSVEDQLQWLAPNDEFLYTEEDLEQAFGEGTQRPDIAIYFGSTLVFFEIVSGRLTDATRSLGDPESFKRDTEKLVMKKLRQLDDASKKVLSDESGLTGRPATPDLKIVPVVVQAESFPSDALTLGFVEDSA